VNPFDSNSPENAVVAAITPAIAQPADVALRFDCSAFTHILWACLPPSTARDTANAMTSAFMSEAIRLGRERHMSDGKLNAEAMAALQRQRAKTGNTCSRLDALVRNYGKLCDALIDANKLLTKPTGGPDLGSRVEVAAPERGAVGRSPRSTIADSRKARPHHRPQTCNHYREGEKSPSHLPWGQACGAFGPIFLTSAPSPRRVVALRLPS